MLFNGQTFELSLDTDVDVTAFTGVIRYKKPNGVHGEFAGSISNDTVTYSVQVGDMDVSGFWLVQAKATQGAEARYGKWTVVEIKTPL